MKNYKIETVSGIELNVVRVKQGETYHGDLIHTKPDPLIVFMEGNTTVQSYYQETVLFDWIDKSRSTDGLSLMGSNPEYGIGSIAMNDLRDTIMETIVREHYKTIKEAV